MQQVLKRLHSVEVMNYMVQRKEILDNKIPGVQQKCYSVISAKNFKCRHIAYLQRQKLLPDYWGSGRGVSEKLLPNIP